MSQQRLPIMQAIMAKRADPLSALGLDPFQTKHYRRMAHYSNLPMIPGLVIRSAASHQCIRVASSTENVVKAFPGSVSICKLDK